MRYKVGDKVRVRKDLVLGEFYGGFGFCYSMEKLKGKTVTIRKVMDSLYLIKNSSCLWSDEMLEPVEDIIEYKGKKYDVDGEDNYIENGGALHLRLYEHKEEILNEVEKRYLKKLIKSVIEPTHNKIKCIYKTCIGNDNYYIQITLDNEFDEDLFLPFFKDSRMYKGMELDKEYSLEELGLK